MSEVIKPTPGPWEASRNDEAVCGQWSIRVPGKHPVISYEIAEITGYRIDGTDEVDARLMAEAGTVFHETQLSPRQLLEQRDELLSALRTLHTRLSDCADVGAYAYEAYDSFYQALVHDAIAKCEGFKP